MEDERLGRQTYQSAAELAELGPAVADLSARLEKVNGYAIDWNEWYARWCAQHKAGQEQTKQEQTGSEAKQEAAPTHLQVTAVDEFRALIPWKQLTDAFIVYAKEDGTPLDKGFPMRLYVPHGSSDCLHVKGVVSLRVLYNPALGEQAEYGFLNTISPEQLFGGAGRGKE